MKEPQHLRPVWQEYYEDIEPLYDEGRNQTLENTDISLDDDVIF